METKQYIVIRRKYPDGKGGTKSVRRGKEIAQGGHASGAFVGRRICSALRKTDWFGWFRRLFNGNGRYVKIWLSDAEQDWFLHSYAKVGCQVQDEAELLEVYEKAKACGFEVHLITDSGRTEFDQPTHTAVAIGPDDAELLDPIFGKGKLDLY